MNIKGWVYVISNQAMPGIVKVGFSTKDPHMRAQELAGTGVPHPFKVEFEALVDNPRDIEQSAHRILNHLHESKEWFRCTAAYAVEVVRSLAAEIYHQRTYFSTNEGEDLSEATENKDDSIIEAAMAPDPALINDPDLAYSTYQSLLEIYEESSLETDDDFTIGGNNILIPKKRLVSPDLLRLLEFFDRACNLGSLPALVDLWVDFEEKKQQFHHLYIQETSYVWMYKPYGSSERAILLEDIRGRITTELSNAKEKMQLTGSPELLLRLCEHILPLTKIPEFSQLIMSEIIGPFEQNNYDERDDLGVPMAELMLDFRFKNHNKHTNAIKTLERFAERGSIKALTSLGYLYYCHARSGEVMYGAPYIAPYLRRDAYRDQCIAYYTSAAELGSYSAMLDLARICGGDFLNAIDLDKARYWSEKAKSIYSTKHKSSLEAT